MDRVENRRANFGYRSNGGPHHKHSPGCHFDPRDDTNLRAQNLGNSFHIANDGWLDAVGVNWLCVTADF